VSRQDEFPAPKGKRFASGEFQGMQELKKLLIFLCPRAAKACRGKLSCRLADRLETLGIGNIGTLKDLSQQHSLFARI
jgi:hypothetical protein